jgi:NitT/TauT family transport system substrate-binding protein
MKKKLIRALPFICSVVMWSVSAAWSASEKERSYPSHRERAAITVSYAAVSQSYSAIWVAREAGMFERNGLDVELVFVGSGATNIQAVINNDVQIAVTGSAAIVSAAAGGVDLVMVGSMYDGMLFDVIADKSIKKASDLKGKKIGISRFGGSSHYAIVAMLKKMSLDPAKDVTIVQAGTDRMRAGAIVNGAINATAATPPLDREYKNLGIHKLLSIKDLAIPYVNDAIVVSRGYYRENRDTVQKFLRALVESFAFFKNKANRDTVVKVMAKYLALDVGRNREVLNEMYDLFAGEVYRKLPLVSASGLRAVIDDVAERDSKAKLLAPEKLIDNSILRELEKSGFVDDLYKIR